MEQKNENNKPNIPKEIEKTLNLIQTLEKMQSKGGENNGKQ